MKKYWPVLSLAVVSLMGLGIYYIDMARALSFQHDFTFETLAGDEAMIEDVLFETGYQEQRDYRNYYIQNGETQLVRNHEFYFTSNYEMLQLFKEHQSFFRAKLLSGQHLYNDEQSIAYVYIDDQYHYNNPTEIHYEVALYDKNSKQQQQYEFITKVDEVHHWQTVEWVYLDDEELMTLSIRNEKSGKHRVILTTFDLQKETVEEKVLVDSTELLNVRFNHSAITYNTNNYALFDTYDYNSNDTASTEQMYLFNAQTKDLTNVAKPAELKNPTYIIEDKHIVAYKKVNDTAAIALYDLAAGNWQQAFSVPLQENPLFDSFNVQLLDEKLFMLYQTKNANIIDIVQSDGQNLYTGLLKVKDVEAEHSLYVHRVYEH